MSDINKIFKIKNNNTSFNTLRQSMDATEDYAVKKNINTQEGTIEMVPINDNHIVNKKYVDTEISAIPLVSGTTAGQMMFWNGTTWTYTETSELFWDDTNKRVGIGTVSPDSQVHIVGASTDGVLHIASSTFTDGGFYITGTSDNIGVFSAGTYYDRPATDWRAVSTEAAGFEMKDGGIKFRMNTGLTVGNTHELTDRVRFMIDANNATRVGVGLGQNVNPDYTFHAKAESGNGFITFFTEDTTATAGIALGDKDRQWGGQLLYDNATDFLTLKADVNSVITIDGPNERVGINWTNPTFNFGVVGTSLMYGTFQVGTSATYNFPSEFYGTVKIGIPGTNYSEFGIRGQLTLPAGTATAGTAPLKFTAGTALTTPETGTIEFHDDRFFITNVDRRRAIDRTNDIVTSTTEVVNTVTETTIYTGNIEINGLKAGNVLKLNASGSLSNDSASDDITIRIYLGTDEVLSFSPAIGNVSDAHWHIQGNMTVRTTGASGTMAYHLDAIVDDHETLITGLGSVDTTAAQDFTVTVEWDNAKADNTIKIYQGFTEWKG